MKSIVIVRAKLRASNRLYDSDLDELADLAARLKPYLRGMQVSLMTSVVPCAILCAGAIAAVLKMRNIESCAILSSFFILPEERELLILLMREKEPASNAVILVTHEPGARHLPAYLSPTFFNRRLPRGILWPSEARVIGSDVDEIIVPNT